MPILGAVIEIRTMAISRLLPIVNPDLQPGWAELTPNKLLYIVLWYSSPFLGDLDHMLRQNFQDPENFES